MGSHPPNVPPCKVLQEGMNDRGFQSACIKCQLLQAGKAGSPQPISHSVFHMYHRLLRNTSITDNEERVAAQESLGNLPVANCLQQPPCESTASHCQRLIASIIWAIHKERQPKIIGTLTERKSSKCPKIQRGSGEEIKNINSFTLFLSFFFVQC